MVTKIKPIRRDVSATFPTKYILFTGLPGGGKSSTISGLKQKLETNGKTVVFRDEIMRGYSTRQLYWYTLSRVPLLRLLHLAWFWFRYPVNKSAKIKSSYWQIWNKKLTLWKRMVLAHMIVAVEQPDYFFDESIQAQYRFIDVAYEREALDQWSVYPGSQLHLVVIDTPIELAAERQVKREIEDESFHKEAIINRLQNRHWFETMKNNISAVVAMMHDIDYADAIIVDGTKEIKINIDTIYDYLQSN